MRRRQGFTLLEVMVATVIIAVGFAAVWRAGGLAADALDLTRNKTLAMWAAKNRMAEYRMMEAWPEPGEVKGGSSSGSEMFAVRETVTKTKSPNFRKIKIEVTRRDGDSYVLAKLTGYVLNERALQEKQAQ